MSDAVVITAIICLTILGLSLLSKFGKEEKK